MSSEGLKTSPDLHPDGGTVDYAARVKSSICRNQLVNGFQLVKIWATISKSLIPNG